MSNPAYLPVPEFRQRLSFLGEALSAEDHPPGSARAELVRALNDVLKGCQSVALATNTGPARRKEKKAASVVEIMDLLHVAVSQGLSRALQALRSGDLAGRWYHYLRLHESEFERDCRWVPMVLPFGEQVWTLRPLGGLTPVPDTDPTTVRGVRVLIEWLEVVIPAMENSVPDDTPGLDGEASDDLADDTPLWDPDNHCGPPLFVTLLKYAADQVRIDLRLTTPDDVVPDLGVAHGAGADGQPGGREAHGAAVRPMWTHDQLRERADALRKISATLLRRLVPVTSEEPSETTAAWEAFDDAIHAVQFVSTLLNGFLPNLPADFCSKCHRTRKSGGHCLLHRMSETKSRRALHAHRLMGDFGQRWRSLFEHARAPKFMMHQPVRSFRGYSAAQMAQWSDAEPAPYAVTGLWDGLPGLELEATRSQWCRRFGLLTPAHSVEGPLDSALEHPWWPTHGPRSDDPSMLVVIANGRHRIFLARRDIHVAWVAFEVQMVSRWAGPRLHARMRTLLAWMCLMDQLHFAGPDGRAWSSDHRGPEGLWLNVRNFWALWFHGVASLRLKRMGHPFAGVDRWLPLQPPPGLGWLWEGADSAYPADFRMGEGGAAAPMDRHRLGLTLLRQRAWEETVESAGMDRVKAHHRRERLFDAMAQLRPSHPTLAGLCAALVQSGEDFGVKLSPEGLRTLVRRRHQGEARSVSARQYAPLEPWETGEGWR